MPCARPRRDVLHRMRRVPDLMRIVSLVPAGTEIVAALGLGDQLVAVTHDCDFPPAVRSLPRLTRSTIPAGATSREIDTAVRTAGERGDSTFHFDATALRASSSARRSAGCAP